MSIPLDVFLSSPERKKVDLSDVAIPIAALMESYLRQDLFRCGLEQHPRHISRTTLHHA